MDQKLSNIIELGKTHGFSSTVLRDVLSHCWLCTKKEVSQILQQLMNNGDLCHVQIKGQSFYIPWTAYTIPWNAYDTPRLVTIKSALEPFLK